MNFVKAGKLSELPPGSAKTAQVEGRAVALYNVGGRVHATDDACLHMGGPLGEGTLDGCKLTCPWHAWHYDVTTGACDRTKDKLAVHAVKVEGDDILVALSAAAKA